MPAPVVAIDRLTGPSGTIVQTDITGTTNRANAADVPNDVGTFPIRIPSSGNNFSYWVVTRLNCTSAPDHLITNLKWYTSGTNPFGTGVTMVVGTAAAYSQATGTPGITGTDAAISYVVGTDAFAFTVGAPLSVPGSTTGTGLFGDFVVYQLVVAPTAPAAGVIGTPLITWTYDYD